MIAAGGNRRHADRTHPAAIENDRSRWARRGGRLALLSADPIDT
jgi:hypothetical protein